MPQESLFKKIRNAPGFAPLFDTLRDARDYCRKDPLITAAYRKIFERNRLKLPWIAPESLNPAAGNVILPALYPLFAGEDAPLNDMLFLLNLAKGMGAKRILEIGTYRARTTYALHLNCPGATVISYDIQVLDSEFRRCLSNLANIELRHASFSASAERLLKEPAFDFIFVDGSHEYEHVIEDSRLALKIIAAGGAIVWHDYRFNDHPRQDVLRVPEALDVIAADVKISAVRSTMCAVHINAEKLKL